VRTSFEPWLIGLLLVATPALAQEPAPETSEPAPTESPEPEPVEPAPEAVAPEEARAYARLVDDALREFGVGHYREAADSFREALALRPSARVLRGLGKALFELGEYVDASTAFERSLAHPVDPLTETLRADVEALLARSERHIATLVVDVNVEGAELLLDGRSIEPGRRRIDAGERRLQARAPGHEPYDRILRAPAGERTMISVVLEPRAEGSTTIVHESASPTLWWGVSTATVGLVGVIAGSAWLADRVSAASSCSDTSGVSCSNRATIVGQRRGAAAVVGLGGAALIAGAVLLFMGLGEEDEAPDRASLRCAPLRTGAACGVGGHF